MQTLKRVGLTFLMTLGLSVVYSLYVMYVLPSPPGAQFFSFLLAVLFFVLIGPLTFAWAWGPHPMGAFYIFIAFAVPISSWVCLYLGCKKERLRFLLPLSAFMWSSLGGFSAYLAISGTI